MITTPRSDFKPGTLIRFHYHDLYGRYDKDDLGIVVGAHLIHNSHFQVMILHAKSGVACLHTTIGPELLYVRLTYDD